MGIRYENRWLGKPAQPPIAAGIPMITTAKWILIRLRLFSSILVQQNLNAIRIQNFYFVCF